jgi:diguanylate cyclase (GGDEF)-like protein
VRDVPRGRSAARYGGEEIALILPHIDPEGEFDLAARARAAIEAMAVPRLDHQGWLKITTSVGVAASSGGRGDALVATADAALCVAKRSGRNRTIRTDVEVSGEDVARELARSAKGTGDE